MVETIRDNDVLIAIIIRANFEKEGIEFFTPPYFSQQLGYMKREKGYNIEAHTHQIVERKVSETQEVLFIKSGKVKITLFDHNFNFLEDKIVTTGDVILLAAGGHALEMLEESELIEVKQGPYAGDQDKVRLNTINVDSTISSNKN